MNLHLIIIGLTENKKLIECKWGKGKTHARYSALQGREFIIVVRAEIQLSQKRIFDHLNLSSAVKGRRDTEWRAARVTRARWTHEGLAVRMDSGDGRS